VDFHHFPSSAALAEASGTFTDGTYQYVQNNFLLGWKGKIKVKRWIFLEFWDLELRRIKTTRAL
jgi:hypothetical protein